jgi:hypothetical protein
MIWYMLNGIPSLKQGALITIFGSDGARVEEILVGPEDGKRN